ncbi:hypothetical protein KKC47_01410, partial [Patescibacteria group bacterium]|nr:hypothetical protein [Patescibacteria group bacterium]
MFWRKRSKKAIPKSDASVLFIFIAAVGTLILASTVISLGSARRISVEDSDASFFNRAEQALPADASGPMSSIQIEPAVKPTSVFFYWQTDQPVLSLIQWDTRVGRFVPRFNYPLHGQFNQTEAPQLKQIQSGWGGEAVIELRSVSAAMPGTETVALVQLKDQRLKQLALR